MPKSGMKEKLTTLRNALLQLHQAMLEYQRAMYEKQYGRVGSTGKMFKLAASDKEFAWLRSLSELIVGVDAYIEGNTFTVKNVRNLMQYTKRLLSPSKKRGEFERLYSAALQNDPAVLLAHGKVVALLPKNKS